MNMNMKDIFSPDPNQTRLLAFVYAVLGIIVCFFGRGIIIWAVRLIGVFAVLYGAFELYLYFGRNHRTTSSPLMIGLPCLIIGMILWIWPNALVNVFPIAIGIVLVFNSILGIQKAFLLKDSGFSNWVISLVGALIMLGGGIFLIAFPERSVTYMFRLCGLFLLAEAALLLFNSFGQQKFH